jgi:hypothetical protein
LPSWREPARLLFLILALFVAVELGQDAYRWIAYRGERAQLRDIGPVLDSAGVAMVRGDLRIDSLRAVIAGRDRELDRMSKSLDRYTSHSVDGSVPIQIYGAYRRDLARYNHSVDERNRLIREYQLVSGRRSDAAQRYYLLADSMRALAKRMGDPYYEVPLPAELAVKHGVRPPKAASR